MDCVNSAWRMTLNNNTHHFFVSFAAKPFRQKTEQTEAPQQNMRTAICFGTKREVRAIERGHLICATAGREEKGGGETTITFCF
jgi:hypothetical protein